MANPYRTQPIPLFPPDIDRHDFGNWLSGFTDGEASFILKYLQQGKWIAACAEFSIKLRQDDISVLYLIQAFFGCGFVHRRRQLPDPRGLKSKPTAAYVVRKTRLLTEVIIPHFQKHHLHAKKKRDFLIWKEGVSLAHSVNLRPRRGLGSGYGLIGGTHPHWTPQELADFKKIYYDLKAQRCYEPTDHVVPVVEKTRTLFDEL